MSELDRLDWLLEHHPKAAEIAPRGRGRPADWTRKIEAIQKLRSVGITKISDAPGSRCVRVLTDFLDEKLCKPKYGSHKHAAAELAGTLLELLRTIEVRLDDKATTFRPSPPEEYSTS